MGNSYSKTKNDGNDAAEKKDPEAAETITAIVS